MRTTRDLARRQPGAARPFARIARSEALRLGLAWLAASCSASLAYGGEPTDSVAVEGSVPVTGDAAKVAVYVGYYDTHHPYRRQPKPSPWKGSSNVVFVGKPDNGSSGWDTSALRIDNLGSSSINVNVTVDIGTKRYALWGTRSVGAGKILILAQTAYENFDGSDTNPAGCYGCSKDLCVKRVRKTVPVVHVTIDGKRTDYYDVEQILNTRGVDGAGCPYTGKRNDESHNWVAITGQTTKPTNLGPAVDEEAFEEPVLSLAAPYPNPTRGSIEFDFRTPRDGPVRFAIYDVAGRLVRTVLDEVVEGGYYHAHVDLQGANAGIYYCSLSTRTEVVRGRFVMVK